MNSHHTPATFSSTRTVRRAGTTALVLAAATASLLTGCSVSGNLSGSAAGTTGTAGTGDAPAASPDTDATAGTPTTKATSAAPAPGSTHPSKAPRTPKTSPTSWHTSAPAELSGPTVSFTVEQKPKCPEGTAVFRSENVPLVLSWKITGATGAALSVDAPGQVGTYGSYGVEGTETFSFSCGGEVGSTETHTYAIYSVGGDEQKGKTLTVSTKILDQAKPV